MMNFTKKITTAVDGAMTSVKLEQRTRAIGVELRNRLAIAANFASHIDGAEFESRWLGGTSIHESFLFEHVFELCRIVKLKNI